jgi:DNA transformation protein
MPSQAQVEEMFAVIDGTSVRKMFGGLGVFRRGIMYALVADDVLYLKADEATSPGYEAEGSQQWVYDGRDRAMPMPYWRLPDRLFDEPDEFREWALAAFAVAERTTKPKKATRAAAGGAPAAARPSRAAAKPARPAKKVGKKPVATAAAKKPAAKKPAAKTARRAGKKPKTARSRLSRPRR